MVRKQRITAIVGAQYGSEGKGVVADHMAGYFDVAVRTGAPNAGHSIVYQGKLYKMQSLPVAWTNPECKLVIGPGALINLDILSREIEMVKEHFPDVMNRIFIDYRAGIIEPRHHQQEGGTRGDIHKRIGSTGEGVGAARLDRIGRNPDNFKQAQHMVEKYGLDSTICDTVKVLNAAVDTGASVMLEGTQGSGLSLIHGPWPYVTSNDTNAAQMAADAGLAPQVVTDVVLVARTFPIRVAGNSGPLANETNWGEMSERLGKSVEERTTVTNKVRRVGAWDERLVAQAIRLNRPRNVALTFLDYVYPGDEWKTDLQDLSREGRVFVEYVERAFNTRVSLIGTGFSPEKGWWCIDRGLF